MPQLVVGIAILIAIAYLIEHILVPLVVWGFWVCVQAAFGVAAGACATVVAFACMANLRATRRDPLSYAAELDSNGELVIQPTAEGRSRIELQLREQLQRWFGAMLIGVWLVMLVMGTFQSHPFVLKSTLPAWGHSVAVAAAVALAAALSFGRLQSAVTSLGTTGLDADRREVAGLAQLVSCRETRVRALESMSVASTVDELGQLRSWLSAHQHRVVSEPEEFDKEVGRRVQALETATTRTLECLEQWKALQFQIEQLTALKGRSPTGGSVLDLDWMRRRHAAACQLLDEGKFDDFANEMKQVAAMARK